MKEIGFLSLHPDAVMPARAHSDDAGLDVFAVSPGELLPGEYAAVPLGFAMQLPEGHACLVLPRSGLAANHGIGIVNSPGLIDAGYRGEVKALLINQGKETFSWQAGMRIAQLLPIKLDQLVFMQSKKLDQTRRGQGGFGSSGLS